MDNIKQRLITLLESKELTVEDSRWLLNYLEENDSTILKQLMQAEFTKNVENKEHFNNEAISKELLANIHQVLESRQAVPAGKIRNMQWRKIAVAASVIFLLGISAYYFAGNSFKDNNETAVKSNPTKDIEAPLLSKASITLANGQTVLLDSLHNGVLATQGNVAISKTADGQIIYNGETDVMAYNTLTNPRGSTIINLTLSDGTKVWLNSESSLKYPTAFSGAERKVAISGEGYFEVAKNANMPFKVDVTGKGEVEVLGTHFNVNAYEDEESIKTTLLEGSVKVKGMPSNKTLVLTPGQQAQLNIVGNLYINNNVNINEVMAWKNGAFQFDNADLKTIMRQVMRWYDVEVTYEKEIPNRFFTANISRDKTLMGLLKILELSKINFKLNGKKLIVMP